MVTRRSPVVVLMSRLHPDPAVMIGVQRTSLVQACLAVGDVRLASAVLVAAIDDWLDTQPTWPGTPCANCGKPIGKGYIRYAPYTDVCRGLCLTAYAMKDLDRRVKVGLPLFDDMLCGCCEGKLKVFAARVDAPYDQVARICDLCSFRRCPKGEQCMARAA